MELWTQQHTISLLPSVAAMVLLSLLLHIWLGKKSFRIRMIPIQIIAVILVLLEVGKQTISLIRGYDLYNLPFHFCSLFIFALPAMAFYRGKLKERVCIVTTALCAAVFSLMLIYPNLIYSAWAVEHYFEDFMAFHTVTFHNLVMLAFLLIAALNLSEPAKGDAKAIFVFVAVFCVVSASMAHILKTNYANFYTCNIPVLETVRLAVQDAVGAIPAKLLYISILSVLNLVYVYGAYWLYRLVRKLFVRTKITASV